MGSLSQRKVQRITGLTVHVERTGGGWVASGSADDGRNLSAWGKTMSEAVNALVHENWRWIQKHVARRQNYRCSRCGRLAPLQFHHIQPRSRGRFDAPDNITGLCPECHHHVHFG